VLVVLNLQLLQIHLEKLFAASRSWRLRSTKLSATTPDNYRDDTKHNPIAIGII